MSRISVRLDGSYQIVYCFCMTSGDAGSGAEPILDHRWGVWMKKDYHKPEIKAWGTVADLTATGMTNPGNDAKSGSASSMGG